MHGGWSWSLPTQDAASDNKAVALKMSFRPEDAVAEKGTFEGAEALSIEPKHPYGPALAELRSKCPEFVEHARWQQAITDGENFLAARGASAYRLGWTTNDLFGLPPVPSDAARSHRRLARDDIGLIWVLQGSQVGAMSAREAYVQDGPWYRPYYRLGL
jgi:hypothetical protein